MKSADLTKYLISELHRLVAANASTTAVVEAMKARATNPILVAALEIHHTLCVEEQRVCEWLLVEQGEQATPSPARPVTPKAPEGWLATIEEDNKLRDLELATVCTQLQSFHLASWLGVHAWLRVLELHAEADVAEYLCAELRRLEREIETLRPSLARLVDDPGDTTERYHPSERRAYRYISAAGLRI